MKRHFDKTIYQGLDDGDLHHRIIDICPIPSDNLMFRAAYPDVYASDDDFPRVFARSCYEAIAVLEAALDTVPEEIAKRAKRDVRMLHLRDLERIEEETPSKLVGAIKIDPDSDDGKEVLDMVGRLFGGGDDE